MTRMAWMLLKTTLLLAAAGAIACAAPSSSECGDAECDDASGGSGDTTAGASSSSGASTSTRGDASTSADGSDTAGPTTMSTTDPDGTTTEPSASTSDDGSATTGEPPVECPESTHVCLGAPPLNWTGPFVRREAAGEQEPAACGFSYDVDAGAYTLDPSSTTHSCGCTCGDPMAVSCPSSLRHSADAVCNAIDPTIAMNSNNCVNITDTSHDYWQVIIGMSGGSCTAMPSSNIAPVTYDASVRFCGPTEPHEGCSPAEVCLPIPSSPVQDVWCIVRDGEHECPADGPYTVGGPRFTSYEDTRGCGGCTCGSPAGTCSGYGVTLYTDDACGVGSFGGSVDETCSLDTTAAAPTIRSIRRNGASEVDASCTPTGGDEIGALTLLDPVTICCTE